MEHHANVNTATLMMESIGHVFCVPLYLLAAYIVSTITLQEGISALPDSLVFIVLQVTFQMVHFVSPVKID